MSGRSTENELLISLYGPIGVALGVLATCAACALMVGCGERSTRSAAERYQRQTEAQWREELFQYAVDNLQRLDEFKDDDMRNQIVDRLNQWIQGEKPIADWKPDPMLKGLPQAVAELPVLKTLEAMRFEAYDGYALAEAVSLRDVSRWARGEEVDELARAKRLFDWTIRNIQLENDLPASAKAKGRAPWETILFGRGTATERAWVFILLLRQQGIDAVVLALPGDKDSLGVELREWAVAVGKDRQWYLFDCRLGLPIPRPGGVRFDEEGQLQIEPATLDQVVQDPSLLRALDVGPDLRYPVEASQLGGVVALIEGSPSYLAERMAVLEGRLVGEQRIVLSAAPSKVAEGLRGAVNVRQTRLWDWPIEVVAAQAQPSRAVLSAREAAMRPFRVGQLAPLWKGRLLYLKGQFSGQEGATYWLQASRPSDREIAAMRLEPPKGLVGAQAAQWTEATRSAMGRAKQDASYWLGLIAWERRKWGAAVDYFAARTLGASPDGPWTRGARYNLARTYESSGEFEKAVRLYTSESESPGYAGERLRGRWLQEEMSRRAEQERQESSQEGDSLRLPSLEDRDKDD